MYIMELYKNTKQRLLLDEYEKMVIIKSLLYLLYRIVVFFSIFIEYIPFISKINSKFLKFRAMLTIKIHSF